MTSSEDKLLQIFRAKLAATKTLHKLVAYKCGVSRSMFSQYINGDLPMPGRVQTRLITLLDLKSTLERLAKNNKEV